MSAVVYATTDAGRLGAQLDSDGMVHVWRTDGPALGLYRVARFTGGRLTSSSLRELFTPTQEPKRSCVGCFEPMPGEHSLGCPTGQNGTPNYN